MEIDWVLYLPSHGNDGRSYPNYGVAYLDRKKGSSQPGRRISLKDVLDIAAIKNRYPHTVGFFLNSEGKGKSWEPDYLRTKKVNSRRGLYNFFKELSL